MKDLMLNLFTKPKVIFMLMVICLSPPAAVQTLHACPLDTCRDLLDVWRAATDAAAPYLRALREATEDYDRAHAQFELAEENRENAGHTVSVLALAAAAALLSGNPRAYITALLALVLAERAYRTAKRARDLAFETLEAAEEDMEEAHDAYMPYHEAVMAARAAYDAAGCPR
jgi:hypothetical protein